MFRIFEEVNGQPATLFHGVKGSRKLPLNIWIKSETKMVKEGTNGTLYKSGFHVLSSKEDVVKFAKVFKNRKNRFIVKVDALNLRRKKNSKSPIFLAKKMRIDQKDWEKRIPI